MNIIDIRLLSSRLDIKRDVDISNAAEVQVEVEITTSATFDEEKLVITGEVTAESKGNESPCAFMVTMGGKFAITTDEKKELDRICKINIPGILFPYVRECVADLTRRGSITAIHLPPVNFVELAKTSTQLPQHSD